MRKIIIVFLFFVLLDLIFFLQVLQGKLPAPLDAMIGAYYPWLDYKWGYSVGVPVKNSVLSDVFGQYYPWQELVHSLLRKGIIPLWNPYSFAGTPLIANWQSAAFYPLNLFFLLVDHSTRWTMTIMLQPLLSLLFMYLFLRRIHLSTLSSIFGSITFSFSGFMMIFLEYNSFAQTAIWLPLILYLVESYIITKKVRYLIFIPFSIYNLLTAGNFQVSLYSLSITCLYILLRILSLKLSKTPTSYKPLILLMIFMALGIGLSGIQLLPTLELFQNSIRTTDQNILEYNFGLLPLKNLITFIAPDFFGNPVTGNFWGKLYHEQSGYFSIIALPLIIAALVKKRDFITIFFGFIFIFSLILVFDSIIARTIYLLKVPLISTSYASRMLFVIDFSAAVLAAKGFDLIKTNPKIIQTIAIYVLAGIMGIVGGIIASLMMSESEILKSTYQVSIKNLILPTALLIFLLSLIWTKKLKIIYPLIFALLIFDLFRFGLKYNSFTSKDFIYPTTPIISFLQQNVGFNRIDKEHDAILPSNTWIMYRLMSPSGYDPLYSKQYGKFYNVYTKRDNLEVISRYANLDKYDNEFLDLLGVKYLLAAKRNKDSSITPDGDRFYNISDPKLKPVFEDKSMVVLENTDVMPRVSLFDQFDIESNYSNTFKRLQAGYPFKEKVILDQQPQYLNLKKSPNDKAEIVTYSPNEVEIKTNTKQNTILVLTDSYYPGWKAEVNKKPVHMYTADGIFRAIELTKGENQVRFYYQPESFKKGVIISLLSLIGIASFSMYFYMKKFF